jgi:hypothetical protein
MRFHNRALSSPRGHARFLPEKPRVAAGAKRSLPRIIAGPRPDADGWSPDPGSFLVIPYNFRCAMEILSDNFLHGNASHL